MSQTPVRSAAEIAAATPADRDRCVDTLRVSSLLVVMIGHWLMVVLSDDLQITNALAIVPSLQPLTWALQVMPLFFLVGGVAHAHTLESLDRRRPPGPGRYAAFFHRRAVRLLRPSLAFLVVWVALGVAADLSGLTSRTDDVGRLARDVLVMVPQLLWFVGIYLGACAFAPLMRNLHERWGLRVVAALVALAVAVDVVRFNGGPELVGNLNFAFVWLALHQLGFAWRDGLLTTPRGWAMAVAGYGAMLLAVTVGPYPTSMVGLPGEDISNMAPPTAALLAQGIGICGLAVVLRPLMTRVLSRARVWAAVVVVSPFAMTAFLWHLTALMTVLVSARALGVDQPPVASLTWWLTRPLLFAVLALVTAALVAVFVRFDRGAPPAARSLDQRRWVDPVAALAALVLFFGILIVSIVGVDVLGNRPVFFLVGEVTPIVGFAVLGLGLALLQSPQVVRRPSRA
ncbi:MAG TPA: acyltransferase [Humibacillus sp.]|nr:acyltransferase [Humibacillus sp.]